MYKQELDKLEGILNKLEPGVWVRKYDHLIVREFDGYDCFIRWEKGKYKCSVSYSNDLLRHAYRSLSDFTINVTDPHATHRHIQRRLLTKENMQQIAEYVFQARESQQYAYLEEEARKELCSFTSADLPCHMFLHGVDLRLGNYRTALKFMRWLTANRESLLKHMGKK